MSFLDLIFGKEVSEQEKTPEQQKAAVTDTAQKGLNKLLDDFLEGIGWNKLKGWFNRITSVFSSQEPQIPEAPNLQPQVSGQKQWELSEYQKLHPGMPKSEIYDAVRKLLNNSSPAMEFLIKKAQNWGVQNIARLQFMVQVVPCMESGGKFGPHAKAGDGETSFGGYQLHSPRGQSAAQEQYRDFLNRGEQASGLSSAGLDEANKDLLRYTMYLEGRHKSLLALDTIRTPEEFATLIIKRVQGCADVPAVRNFYTQAARASGLFNG